MKSTKKILIGRDISFEQWVSYMEKKPEDVTFQTYQFPTDEIKEKFIRSIHKYSEEFVEKVLRSFLFEGGTFGSDQFMLEHLADRIKKDPSEISNLMKNNPYWRRLILHLLSQGKIPVFDGITWVVDLLPLSPREALDALQAYLHSHIGFLPDGRMHGLSDAEAIIRARYFDTTNESSKSVLFSLKPSEFEHLIEALYYEMGYKTEMTIRSHDGGKDIIATKTEIGKREKNIIQGKLTKNVVPYKTVRELLGTATHPKNNATKGTLIATSHFSSDGKKFVEEDTRLELIDLLSFQRLLNEHLGTFWLTHTDYLIKESQARHPDEKRVR